MTTRSDGSATPRRAQGSAPPEFETFVRHLREELAIEAAVMAPDTLLEADCALDSLGLYEFDELGTPLTDLPKAGPRPAPATGLVAGPVVCAPGYVYGRPYTWRCDKVCR